jgi:hypothetical protein
MVLPPEGSLVHPWKPITEVPGNDNNEDGGWNGME